MSGTTPCGACGRAIRSSARFCRHCGAAIEWPDGLVASVSTVPPRSERAPFDSDGLFRELGWLCGLPLVVSVAVAIMIRVAGDSAAVDVVATLAFACISLGGALKNRALVGAAFKLPTLRHTGHTLLVALITAPTVLLAFWVLEHWLGFQMWDAYLDSYVRDHWPVWIGYLALAVVTPITEEVLFRGLLQPKLELVLTGTEAWVVQAALFAAAHLSPAILVTHFALGLALGWVRRQSGSLLPGIFMHGAWNAWVVWSSSP